MSADTFLVIARFPHDDVVIECKSDLESAKELARVIVAEPDVLRGNLGESFSFWFGGSKHKPDISELDSVGILKLLGGVVSLGGRFPLEEGLFSRLFDVRRLPMLLCCHRNAPVEAARQTDQTLRLFHAAGAMLAMRIYPGSNPLSEAVLADVNRWLMDEVCGASVPMTASCARD